MKKIIFLFLLTIGLFHSSCEKDPFKDKTVIEGYILEYGSEKPLPNVRINLQRLDGPANDPYTWVVLDSIFTDENGYVHYEFNHNEVTVDKCTFKTPSGYYPIKEHAPNLRKVNDLSRLVDPFAWIGIYLKNTINQSSSDQINIAGGWGGRMMIGFTVKLILYYQEKLEGIEM
ncbi:MAG: hypothetical protein ACJAT4_002182 [Granulosicoccus sp.]|jgi:hypothetical protein